MAKKQAAPAQAMTRIQTRNRKIILAAALEVFSATGYRAATVDAIAARAKMSKPNMLYYFRRKQDIYVALLEETLADWLKPLAAMRADGEPLAEISTYIAAKLSMSEANPKASRLFANEILHGAPMIRNFLSGPLKSLVDEKAALIARWGEDGKIAKLDPYHLIFAIWAITQHYADFSTQVDLILKDQNPTKANTHSAIQKIILQGLAPRS